MSSSQLEMVVKHDGRLNLLCCFLDEGELSVLQLAARIGESAQLVRYWVNLLDSFDLVEKRDAPDGGEPLYAAALGDHPEWVMDAVRQHRPQAA